jgi:hypothetical protein
MARLWEMSPADAQAGDPGPLRIFDPGDGPEGRAVCILPGSLARQAQDSALQWVLDDQDLANATAIMLVPRMREALADLVQWAPRMGGCDAQCWRSVEDVAARLRPGPDAP